MFAVCCSSFHTREEGAGVRLHRHGLLCLLRVFADTMQGEKRSAFITMIVHLDSYNSLLEYGHGQLSIYR